jgi:hypothetical protein
LISVRFLFIPELCWIWPLLVEKAIFDIVAL